MDVTTLPGRIASDHRLLTELLDEIGADWPNASPADDLGIRPVVEPTTLLRLVLAHVEAAALVLGVATERLTDGPARTQLAIEEHKTIREHLAVLQRVPWDTNAYGGALDGLTAELRQHMGPEEDLVARLETALDDRELAALHDQFEHVRAGALLGDAVVPLDPVSARAVEDATRVTSPDETIDLRTDERSPR